MSSHILKNLKNVVTAIALFVLSIFLIKVFYKKPPSKLAQIEWYDDLVFHRKNFSFQLIRTLSRTGAGAAEIGECFATARKIKDGDIYSWYDEWLKTADRIHGLAKEWERDGHIASSRSAYFRASNYYRNAGFYMVAEPDRSKMVDTWQQSRNCFLKAIKTLNDVSFVEIPYENTTLPAYFVKSKKSKASPTGGFNPLLIAHSGFDGTVEEVYWRLADAAHERGYSLLVIEGPGQGEMIFKKNLPFRPDWEKVITPVIDYALTLPNVDKKKIALMGLSMGGYLAPRAAAFDKRISACIANGGILDFSLIYTKAFPTLVLSWVASAPDRFNSVVYNAMKSRLFANWGINNGLWRFAAKTPAELIVKVREYSLKDVVGQISCPTLVVDSEAETFLEGQSKQLYDALKCQKDFILFTREEGAQSHCQQGGTAISNEKVFNWLDEILK